MSAELDNMQLMFVQSLQEIIRPNRPLGNERQCIPAFGGANLSFDFPNLLIEGELSGPFGVCGE